jgi:hypothetical protein
MRSRHPVPSQQGYPICFHSAAVVRRIAKLSDADAARDALKTQRSPRSQPTLAARELGNLTLADALSLLVLIAAQDPDRFSRAAAWWHGRFALEARGLSYGSHNWCSPRSPPCRMI